MNGQKLKGMLGLALRARQAALGMDACRILIRAGKCGVLLLDGGAGPNTRKRAEELCERNGTPLRILPEGMIGEATEWAASASASAFSFTRAFSQIFFQKAVFQVSTIFSTVATSR